MDFSFTTLDNVVTMNDVITTAAAVLAGWTKLAQKQKDDQIKARDETIAYLEKELKKCRERYEEPKR